MKVNIALGLSRICKARSRGGSGVVRQKLTSASAAHDVSERATSVESDEDDGVCLCRYCRLLKARVKHETLKRQNISSRSRPLAPRRPRCPRVWATVRPIEKLGTLRAKLKAEAPRPIDTVLDEKALLAKSSFPIKPEDLIARAKTILIEQSLDFLSNPETVDTKTFVFKSPVMGPLTYAELRRIYTSFSLPEAFPGFFPCYHNFWVDPYEPSRVWFTVRSYMQNTGPLLGHPPTNKIVDETPCMHSLVFNAEGKITKATVGYPMDRDLGNTGGLGSVFGSFYAIGKPFPFPEAQPHKPSLGFRIFALVNNISGFFKHT